MTGNLFGHVMREIERGEREGRESGETEKKKERECVCVCVEHLETTGIIEREYAAGENSEGRC